MLTIEFLAVDAVEEAGVRDATPYFSCLRAQDPSGPKPTRIAKEKFSETLARSFGFVYLTDQ